MAVKYPDWVTKCREKGTEIRRFGDRYYLYKIKSVRKNGKVKKLTLGYLGKITEHGLIKSKVERTVEKITEGKIAVKEYGATYFLTDNNKDITELLKKHFPGSWREILVFAVFRLIRNSPIKNLDFLNSTSFISDTIGADMNDRTIGHLLRSLGVERGAITEFLSNFISGSGYLAVDLTHVFSLSENVISSMTGYNSKRDYTPQVNLLYLFSLTRKMPVYFRTLMGSITSVSSLVLTIKESGAKDVILVGDKGFYSEPNITELEKQDVHYIFPLKRDSSLIDYEVIRSADARRFTGHFVFERRAIHYHSYDVGNRRVLVFLDDKLRAEEMKNAVQRLDDSTREQFYDSNHRMGTIAVITDLKTKDGEEIDGKEIYSFLKQRVNIEQLYDTFKNTLEADRSYMRDDYQLEGWMFINFIVILLYYRLYNLLAAKDTLDNYSIKDVLLHLERIQKLKIGDKWVTSEIPKKTRNLLEKLEVCIT